MITADLFCWPVPNQYVACRRRGGSLVGKRVQQRQTRGLEVPGVAGHDREAVDQRGGSNQFIERVFCVRRAQISPKPRHVGIDVQDVARKALKDGSQPTFKTPRLQRIDAMPDQFDTTAQLADGDRRQKQGYSLLLRICKKPPNTSIGWMFCVPR